MTTTQTTDKAASTGRLAIIGLVTACAVACSLPLLAGAGVIATVAAAMTGAAWLAVALLALTGAAATAWLLRRRTAAAAASCECGGNC